RGGGWGPARRRTAPPAGGPDGARLGRGGRAVGGGARRTARRRPFRRRGGRRGRRAGRSGGRGAARAAADVTTLVHAGRRRLGDVLDVLETVVIDESTWTALDPERRSLFDFDEPSRLER